MGGLHALFVEISLAKRRLLDAGGERRK